MTSGKKKQRSSKNQKLKVQKALNKKARTKMTRQMMIQYAKMRRVPSGGKTDLPGLKDVPNEHYGLDDSIEIASCNGVGECCKNRYIPVDPSDIWRVLRNKRVREKWNVVYTRDLYGEGKPFLYKADMKLKIPGCATVPVKIEGTDDVMCPFYEMVDGKPECILGDDRLTYCLADPITRTQRFPDKRRLHAWSYAHNGMSCYGCMSACPEGQKTIKIEDWLKEKGLEERYRLTDLFLGYASWVRGTEMQNWHVQLSAMLVFNWHDFLLGAGEVEEARVSWEDPNSPEDVIGSATMILENVISRSDSDEVAIGKVESHEENEDTGKDRQDPSQPE